MKYYSCRIQAAAEEQAAKIWSPSTNSHPADKTQKWNPMPATDTNQISTTIDKTNMRMTTIITDIHPWSSINTIGNMKTILTGSLMHSTHPIITDTIHIICTIRWEEITLTPMRLDLQPSPKMNRTTTCSTGNQLTRCMKLLKWDRPSTSCRR